MFAETTLGPMLRFCQTEVQRLIQELESAPSRTAFFDVGAVAEVLVLTTGMPEAEAMTGVLGDAAAKWLKSGLLEDLLMARVEFAYHIALLSYLAQGAESWNPSDIEVIRSLSNGRLIARNEVPALRQHLITAYFSRCGIHTDLGRIGRRSLAQIIDRRVLRARSDEFDLLGLLMCAQLLQLECNAGYKGPRTYPQVQLVQALRAGNRNWLPVLTFLSWRFFACPEELCRAAFKSMQEFIPAEGQLLPSPPANQIDSEYVERTDRGLRLRSTIALALSLALQGELYDA
jgi:hypothetical protein